MSFGQQAARIKPLIGLIDSSSTGTAEDLVKKMGASRRTIFNDLDYLKGRGLSITFDPSVRSYRFEKKRKKFQLF